MNIVKFKNDLEISDWILSNPTNKYVLLQSINTVFNKNLKLNDLNNFLKNFNLLVLGNIFSSSGKGITLETNECTKITNVIPFSTRLVINNINLSDANVTASVRTIISSITSNSLSIPITNGRLIHMTTKCYKCAYTCCCY